MDNQLRRAPQNLTVSAGSEQCEMENNINYNGNDDKMPDGKLKIVTARNLIQEEGSKTEVCQSGSTNCPYNE